MRRIITTILISLILVLFWGDVYAQEQPKPPTPAQQIESLTYSILDFKNKLGAEMQISSRLKAQNMMLSKKVGELQEQLKQSNAKIAQLEMKPDETKE